MRKRLWCLGILFVLIATSSLSGQDIRVGVYQNEPKLFVDSQGHAAGFFAELLQEIAKKEQWQLHFYPCVWNDCLDLLEAGKLDIMPDVAHYPERERRFLFGKEAVLSSWSLLYRHRNAQIESILDLQGKRIAVVQGSIQESALRERLKEFGISANIVAVQSFDDAFAMLRMHRVDAVPVNRFYRQHGGLGTSIRATNILLRPSIITFAFNRSRSDVAAAVDTQLKRIKSDPDSIYYSAVDKWLQPPTVQSVPKWFFWSVLGGVIIMIGLVVMTLLFRRMVVSKSNALFETSQKLQRISEQDELTGLPNRLILLDRLSHAVAHAKRHASHFALMFFNLDNFREINEAMNHKAGDAVLEYVAEVLYRTFRDDDTVTRYGGDEFAVIVEHLTSEEILTRMFEALSKKFSEPFFLDQQPIYITFSAGVVLFPQHGSDPMELLNHAVSAMKRAKSEGKNRFEFYTAAMTEKAYDKLLLVTRLREAITHNGLEVYYQPKVTCKGHIVGAEALLRWNDMDLGAVSPEQFIPVAEGHGLIIPIGDFVLRTALRQYRLWNEWRLKPGTLSVNVSMLQLQNEHFDTMLAQYLLEEQFRPEDLEIELTESQLMKKPEAAISMLKRIHALGVGIAIDDFGTGYSSLSYLKELPITALKIDRSFVEAVSEDEGSAKITATIIAMAKNLHLTTIAEGVETEEQKNFLEALECDLFQGYFFSRPVTADAMERLLVQTENQTDNADY